MDAVCKGLKEYIIFILNRYVRPDYIKFMTSKRNRKTQCIIYKFSQLSRLTRRIFPTDNQKAMKLVRTMKSIPTSKCDLFDSNS